MRKVSVLAGLSPNKSHSFGIKVKSLKMNLAESDYWVLADRNNYYDGVDLNRGIVSFDIECYDWNDNFKGSQTVEITPRANGTTVTITSFNAKGKKQNVKQKLFKDVKTAIKVVERGYSDITNWGPEDGVLELDKIQKIELYDMEKNAKKGQYDRW